MGCLCCCTKSESDQLSILKQDGENVNIQNQRATIIKGSYFSETKGDQDEAPIAIQLGLDSAPQPSIQITEFELIKVLGRGSFGKVLLVQRFGKLYAMKILKKAEVEKRNQKQHTQHERLILAVSNSSFVVKLHFAFQTKHKLYLVIDFQQGGELFFHLKKSNRFVEQKARFYAAELLLALEHLHSQKIIYRDLKPENILIGRDGHIKITDFGLSKCGVNKEDKSYSFVGTPEYLAPEILIGQGHNHVCDFWSLGALIYEMLSGAPPFYSTNKNVMFRNRLEKPIEMKMYFSAPTNSLLQGLLCNDPRYRLGAGGYNEIKSHEFFKDIDWDKLLLLQHIPPFIPTLDNERDLRYFDPVFTQEPPKDTPVVNPGISQDKYANFSYYERSTTILQEHQESFQGI